MIPIKFEKSNVFYCRSGTHALVNILKSLKFKKGSEILIPDFTCIWLPLACYFADLKPKLLDVNIHDFNINLDGIKASLSENTVGIIAVDSFGSKIDLDKFSKFCKENNLVFIRDLANGSFDESTFGEAADFTVMSFGNNKYLECNGGGLVITSNENATSFFNKTKMNKRFLKFNFEKTISYSYNYFSAKFNKRNINIYNINNFLMRLSYTLLGDNMFPNYRISRLKALKTRLQKFKNIKLESEKNIKLYKHYLSDHKLAYQELNNSECILKLNIRVSKKRDYIIEELSEIYPLSIQYVPLHVYMNLDSDKFKNSLKLSKQIINLPINYIDSKTVIKLAKKLDELLR